MKGLSLFLVSPDFGRMNGGYLSEGEIANETLLGPNTLRRLLLKSTKEVEVLCGQNYSQRPTQRSIRIISRSTLSLHSPRTRILSESSHSQILCQAGIKLSPSQVFSWFAYSYFPHCFDGNVYSFTLVFCVTCTFPSSSKECSLEFEYYTSLL